MSEREKLLADLTRSIDALATNGPYSTAHLAAEDVLQRVVEACCANLTGAHAIAAGHQYTLSPEECIQQLRHTFLPTTKENERG